MMLRDRMVYGGIRTSKKVGALSWFERDLFSGLIHVADDFGRFEADADMLRAVLYAPCLSKVSGRDVGKALVRLHQAGLVKLYTHEARGYGKVINFRQTLQKRRALYPDEDGPPAEPELFADAPDVSEKKERKKEGGKAPEAPAPLAPDLLSQEEWLAKLRHQWPGLDVEQQLSLAYLNRKKAGRDLERTWFEEHWLPKCSVTVDVVVAKGAKAMRDDIEPEGWRNAIANTNYGFGQIFEVKTWAELPADVKRQVRKGLVP
jgi:hypothetical protein